MKKENKTIDVDKAWTRLHSRLEDENLLPAVSRRTVALKKYIAIAAMLTGIFLGGGIFFYLSDKPKDSGICTLHNTENGFTLVTTLPDGSTIYLPQGSKFSYPRHFAKDIRKVVLNGEAMFEVHGNKQWPFVIETGDITVKVTGTVFNIKSAPTGDKFELQVQEGTVEVTNQANLRKIAVGAGESVRLQGADWLKKETPGVNLHNLYSNRIKFKDEALSDIIPVLNRNGNMPIVLRDPEIGNRRLTVTFSNNSSQSMAELICAALNLQQTVNQNTIYISKPR